MITHLNNYVNVFTPAITGTITNKDWFTQITDANSAHNQTIKTLRAIKQLYVSTNNTVFKSEYDKLKITLPAVTWNATFTSVKSNQNFIHGTGVLFIDIDDSAFDLPSLDLKKIYAYYRSVGGLGYSILVQVKDITPTNFKSTYLSICDDLGITQYIDTNAIKLTQSSILSFDSDLYLNSESFIYSPVSIIKIENNDFVLTSTLESKKEEHNAEVKTKIDIRYNNLDDFNFHGKDYIENWSEGFDYISVSKPFVPLADGRKRYMLNYIRNYVYLNPDVPYYQILNSAKFVNLSVGVEPLPTNLIESQVKTVLEQKNKGTLTPKVKKRKILFSCGCLLTRDEKEKLKGARQSLFFNNTTTAKMYDLIEDWNFGVNGKITIRSLTAVINVSKSSVEKYWKNIKDYVADLNASNADDIRLYKAHKILIDKDIAENDIAPYMDDMTPLNLLEQVLVLGVDQYLNDYELMREIFIETT